MQGSHRQSGQSKLDETQSVDQTQGCGEAEKGLTGGQGEIRWMGIKDNETEKWLKTIAEIHRI